MKKKLYLLFMCVSIYGCAQKKQPLLGETEYQREMNAKFKDATKSPLTEKDRKNFKALDFFKFDSSYVVTANFKRTPNQKTFKMKTTTKRKPLYTKYGELSFSLNGKTHKLNIYQNVKMVEQSNSDSLFLPFLDNTNGESSYAGGRYINVTIPDSDTIIIDFNKAYNPYCAYNSRYSCPVVPRKNYLDTDVKAGVKAYKKH